MSVHQGGLKEESLCKGGRDTVNSLPTGGDEVGAECETNLEKQVFGKDVR